MSDEIKKSFKRLKKFEKRLVKTLGNLQKDLGDVQEGDDFDRFYLNEEEAVKVFKTYNDQFEKTRDVVDDLEDEEDGIYEALVKSKEKLSIEFVTTMSFYDHKRPMPLSDCEIRHKKF